MAEIRLGLLALRSSRLEASLAFYRAIGLAFVEEKHGSGPVHYSCQAGETVIELYPGTPQEPLDPRSSGAALLGFTVESVDSVLAELTQLDAAVISGPKPTPWGRSATVRDPDGRSVALTEPPP